MFGRSRIRNSSARSFSFLVPSSRVPYRPKRTNKAAAKTQDFTGADLRARQQFEQRRAQMATRSTLSRLRNRKSDAK
jgi:hypothetical protein